MIDVSINSEITEVDLSVVFDGNIIDATILHDGPIIDVNVSTEETTIDTSIITELSPVEIDLIQNQTTIDTTIEVSNTIIDILIDTGSSTGNIPQGGLKRQVLKKISDSNNDYSWSYNYEDFLINVQYTGTESNITGGNVLTASIDSEIVYRFISDSTNANGYPVEDSFYKDFNGTTLNNLIKTRG